MDTVVTRIVEIAEMKRKRVANDGMVESCCGYGVLSPSVTSG